MSTAKPDPWPWPGSLDGPIAAAGNHRVLFENDRVRVLETIIRTGEKTAIHTHRAPQVMYVLSGSSFIRRDPAGAVMLDTSKLDPPFVMPPVLWSDFIPSHTIENTGPDDFAVIGVELKD
jgi:mannose-6-phosphate isomerase-like protein (cupin superfamily)